MTSIITTILSLLIDAADLGESLNSSSPELRLNPENAYSQALAAIEASTPEISAEILLGIAWVESRYDNKAISRIEDNKRQTGIPKWNYPPSGTRSFFCGVTQISAGDSWSRCKEFRSTYLAYQIAVEELNRWLAPRICNHNIVCALTGYNGGFPAIKAGRRDYAVTVRRRASLINSFRRKN